MRSPSPATPLVELRGVTKVYREGDAERAVLRGVDATIPRGELCALVGRSGSGKSTLLNLIGGIDVPTAGQVVVDGLSLADASEAARTLFRRRHVGFVFQFYNLIPTLTVEENLRLPLELIGQPRDTVRARAGALLEELGLARRSRAFPEELSGGEQQRVAVARALVHEPVLVLADEPTGNLDVDTGRQVLDLLDRLTRRAGRTMVVATHSPEVAGLADRVLRLEHGHVVDAGGAAPVGSPGS
jgi:putative ABC transport system ATP-binding protein